MDNEIKLNIENWIRQRIEPKHVVVEKLKLLSGTTHKALWLYFIGKEVIETIAKQLELKINGAGNTRWIEWTDKETGIQVVIFE